MNRIFAAAIPVLSAVTWALLPTGSARGGVPVSGVEFLAPSFQAAQGSSGSFDLLVLNPNVTPNTFDLAGETVEMSVSGSGVNFTDTAVNTTTPYVFPDSFAVDTSTPLDLTGVAYPKTEFITSDLSDAPSSFVTLAAGGSYGLVHVSYSIDPSATLGAHALTFEDLGGGTSTSDENGIAVPFFTSNGILTVTPAVPEPASLGLLATGLVLLVRRK
jgi:hypothetical protein